MGRACAIDRATDCSGESNFGKSLGKSEQEKKGSVQRSRRSDWGVVSADKWRIRKNLCRRHDSPQQRKKICRRRHGAEGQIAFDISVFFSSIEG